MCSVWARLRVGVRVGRVFELYRLQSRSSRIDLCFRLAFMGPYESRTQTTPSAVPHECIAVLVMQFIQRVRREWSGFETRVPTPVWDVICACTFVWKQQNYCHL